MGKDIHMSVVDKDSHKIILDNLFDGRNSDWFDNISCRNKGDDDVYDHLYPNYGLPECFVEANDRKYIVENEDGSHGTGYFDFTYIVVKDFIDWFLKYRPDKFAGWVTTYEAWNYKMRNVLPTDGYGDHYIKRRLDKDDVIEDYVFMEFVDEHDCSFYIYEKLLDAIHNKEIKEDDLLVWYFDW